MLSVAPFETLHFRLLAQSASVLHIVVPSEAPKDGLHLPEHEVCRVVPLSHDVLPVSHCSTGLLLQLNSPRLLQPRPVDPRNAPPLVINLALRDVLLSNSGVLGPVCCLGAVERLDVATALSAFLQGKMQKYVVINFQVRDVVNQLVRG